MKLYMKQKVFSIGDQFTVWDANGNDRYNVQGEIFSLGKKLHVNDTSGREVALIKRELFTILPTFHVYQNGMEVAKIYKEFTLFKPKYFVSGLGWDVDGHFLDHDYEISKNGRLIARVSKAWISWGDSYEIDIADGMDEAVTLAVVLAIDCVLDAQQNSNNH